MYEFGIKSFYDKSKLKPKYDVIVIGAGIGGLVCGTFLAKNGKKVLISEQHNIHGGYCTSFKRKGFTFDSAVHHIGACGKWGIVGRCFNELNVDMDFYHLDPMDTLVFPSERIEIPADIEKYKGYLQERFPLEKDNVASFFKEFIKLYWSIINNKEDSPFISKYKDQTYSNTLDNFFSDLQLKAILAGQWGYIGALPDEASTPAVCQMLINYLKDGAYFPIGGTQVFANAILKRFVDLEGEIILSSKVAKIFTKGDKVYGVALEDGKEIVADTVVSNVDAKQTFNSLLDCKVSGDFAKKIESMKESTSFFLLYLGMSSKIDLTTLKRGFYYKTDSPFTKNNWMYISVPTEIDQTLAPENKQIIFTLVSLDKDYEEIDDWKALKDNLIESTIDYLEGFVPKLRDCIEVIDAATPKTLERYTLNSKGAAYGWAATTDQTLWNRLPHTTPLEGLYLAGHWTNPGPGICAVVSSGWRAANIILRHSIGMG